MTFATIRQWSWELPQSLLGAILLSFYEKTRLKTIDYKGHQVYIYDKFPGGVSLGYYILIDYNRYDWNNQYIRQSLKNSIKHEYGHCIQSKYLGIFYLPTVGLLSSTHNILCRIKDRYNISYDYYKFFIEYQADKLGGVIR